MHELINAPSIATAVISALLLGVLGALGALFIKVRATRDGMKCLLRSEIIREHAHYIDRGEIPLAARQNVEESYAAYHALGGNGAITHMVEELNKLPTTKGAS